MNDKKDVSKKEFSNTVLRFSLVVLFLMFIINILSYSKHKDFTLFMILFCMILFVGVLFIVIYIVVNRKSESGKGKSLGVFYRSCLSFNELVILMFYKKICPNCHSKLKRMKEVSNIKEGIEKVGHTYIYGDIYNKRTYFRCEKCNRDFEIMELKK